MAIDRARRGALKTFSAVPVGALLSVLARAEDAAVLNVLPRMALVVGNARYRDLPGLRNAVNDATAFARQVERVRFDVTTLTDAGKSQLEDSIASFTTRLASRRSVGLFYFAGHGLQLSWRNYLVPVDARIAKAADVAAATVDLSALIDGLRKARNPMNVVILDACRDNPFVAELGTAKGLSQMDAPAGTLLAYATAPGNTASDGEGDNGLYTEYLLQEIARPDAKIEDVFKRVRLNVRRVSRGLQVPWESTSLEDDFYFVPPATIRKESERELEKLYAAELELWKRAQAQIAAARSTGSRP